MVYLNIPKTRVFSSFECPNTKSKHIRVGGGGGGYRCPRKIFNCLLINNCITTRGGLLTGSD